MTLAPVAGLAGAWLGFLLGAFGPEGLLEAGDVLPTSAGLGFTGAMYALACAAAMPLIEPRDPPLHGGKATAIVGGLFLLLGSLLGALFRAATSR